jgi:hypothetical protein
MSKKIAKAFTGLFGLEFYLSPNSDSTKKNYFADMSDGLQVGFSVVAYNNVKKHDRRDLISMGIRILSIEERIDAFELVESHKIGFSCNSFPEWLTMYREFEIADKFSSCAQLPENEVAIFQEIVTYAKGNDYKNKCIDYLYDQKIVQWASGPSSSLLIMRSISAAFEKGDSISEDQVIKLCESNNLGIYYQKKPLEFLSFCT